jgi:hypothetical protein
MKTPAQAPVDWLLEAGDAWVQYRTRVDLLGQPESAPEVQAARAAMLNDPRITAMIDSLQDWPGPPLVSHKKAGHHLHILSFLAEIGLRASDPGMDTIVGRVLARQSGSGAFQIMTQIKEAYGGTNQPLLSWALCDAPLVLWSLCRLGARDDTRVRRAFDHIVALVRENGWPCATDPALGFRGPGRKSDPCPYANLISVKALAAYGADDKVLEPGITALLWHWDVRQHHKPYLFGIGTDFHKPKFPLVWYDILHVVDVLSRLPTARADPRYQAILADLMSQTDDEGRFTAASMYQDWKEWEFANKRQPSPAITLVAWRAALRQ